MGKKGGSTCANEEENNGYESTTMRGTKASSDAFKEQVSCKET